MFSLCRVCKDGRVGFVGVPAMAHKEEDNESDQVICVDSKDADDAAQVIGRLIETRHRLASYRPTPQQPARGACRR